MKKLLNGAILAVFSLLIASIVQQTSVHSEPTFKTEPLVKFDGEKAIFSDRAFDCH